MAVRTGGVSIKTVRQAGGSIRKVMSAGYNFLNAALGTPAISLQSGAGYAGSVYRVTNGGTGNWMADETTVIGATATTWTLPLEHEGKTIYWRRNDAAVSNSIEMWVPHLDAPGNIFVMDARQGLLIDANNRVGGWANVRDGVPATESSDAARPTYSTALGCPTLYFDKGDLLTTTGFVWAIPTARLYVGLTTFETTDPSTLLGAVNDGAIVFRRGADRRLSIVKANSAVVASSTDPLSDATPYIVALQTTSTVQSFRINGVANGSVTTSATSFVASTTMSIGAERNTNRHQGHIGTHVICDANVSLDDVRRIEGFIAHTCNRLDLLSSDHPYKSVPPKTERTTYTPFSVAALNPASWHDVSDTATVTLLDGRVNGILDKSPNLRRLYTSTASKQPLYTASDARVGGKTTVSATRSGDILVVVADNLAGVKYAVSDIFIVTQFVDGVANSFTVANSIAGWGPGAVSGNNDGYNALVGGDAAAAGHPRFMGSLNTPRVINTGALDPEGAYRNLGTIKVGNADSRYPPLLPLPWSVLRIVPSYAPGNYTRYLGNSDPQAVRAWAGPWGEVIMFDYVLSERARRALTRYMMTKWGVGTSGRDRFSTGLNGPLNARAANSGQTWQFVANAPARAPTISNAGRVYPSAAETQVMTLGTAVINSMVSVDIVPLTPETDDTAGIVARVDANGQYYGAAYSTSYGGIRLFKWVGNTLTQLGSFAVTIPADQVRRLSLRTNYTRISAELDGIEVCAATDSALVQGLNGIRVSTVAGSTDTKGVHLNNFNMSGD